MQLTKEELELIVRALANQVQRFGKDPAMEALFMKVLKELGYIGAKDD